MIDRSNAEFGIYVNNYPLYISTWGHQWDSLLLGSSNVQETFFGRVWSRGGYSTLEALGWGCLTLQTWKSCSSILGNSGLPLCQPKQLQWQLPPGERGTKNLVSTQKCSLRIILIIITSFFVSVNPKFLKALFKTNWNCAKKELKERASSHSILTWEVS